MVSDKIKKLRLELNLTQEQFAEKLNVSQEYISQIESGKKGIGLGILTKLSKVFDKDFWYFLEKNS
jgi:transcriptional regulator with XRE-family HTH domain